MKCFYFLLLSFSLCIPLAVNAQIEVKTMNPDGTPNSNCYFSVDSVQIGLANRNGYVFIDQSFKGKEVIFKELETGWEDQFILKSDTTIILEEVQILSEVEIKPRNTKKLYKEIMELNQNRLPEKLNLKGEVFFAELNTIKNKSIGDKTDTILDVFSCEVVILDVFGDKTILAKNPIKYREGSVSNGTNEKLFAKKEKVVVSHKIFVQQMIENLNYEIFEMKKFRKYRSSLNIDDRNMNLKFNRLDSSKVVEVKENEFMYTWKKHDSSLVHMSIFYRQGRDSYSTAEIILPFSYRELSIPNNDYSDGYLLSEFETRMINEGQQVTIKSNAFNYFDLQGRVEKDESIQGYKEFFSFAELLEKTNSKKPEDGITPVLYPLRFPISIFY